MTTARRVIPPVALSLALLVASLAPSSARAQEDSEPPAIAHDEVRAATRGSAVVVEATITDPSGVFDPAVLYRVGGAGEFLRLAMAAAGDDASRYRAVIPGEVVSGDLEYFIEAFDERGNGPARYADADLPVRVPVQETAEPALPPPGDARLDDEEDGGSGLWIALGVTGGALLVAAAAAAAVGAYVLLTPPAVPAQVDVVVSGPTPVATGLTP